MKTDNPLDDLTLLTRRILKQLARLSAKGLLQGEHRIAANGKTVYVYIDDMTMNLEQLDGDEAAENLPNPVESFRQGWKEAMTGDVHPIETLWDEMESGE